MGLSAWRSNSSTCRLGVFDSRSISSFERGEVQNEREIAPVHLAEATALRLSWKARGTFELSSSVHKYASVDSAPWLRFTPARVSPSQQPPDSGSTSGSP